MRIIPLRFLEDLLFMNSPVTLLAIKVVGLERNSRESENRSDWKALWGSTFLINKGFYDRSLSISSELIFLTAPWTGTSFSLPQLCWIWNPETAMLGKHSTIKLNFQPWKELLLKFYAICWVIFFMFTDPFACFFSMILTNVVLAILVLTDGPGWSWTCSNFLPPPSKCWVTGIHHPTQ